MLSCPLTRLRLAVGIVVCFSVTTLTERQLLCSSNSVSLWFEYEGPVVLTSVEVMQCTLHKNRLYVTYTGMLMFTPVQIGWNVKFLYKNDMWVELSNPLGPCEDFKACDLIKGETIHETFPIYISPLYLTPLGEYQIIAALNVIDDFDRELTVRANVTAHVRNEKW